MAQYLLFGEYRHNKFEKSCFWSSQTFTSLELQHQQCGISFTNPLHAHPSQGLKGMTALLCVPRICWFLPLQHLEVHGPWLVLCRAARVPTSGCAGRCRAAASMGLQPHHPPAQGHERDLLHPLSLVCITWCLLLLNSFS